MVIISVLTLGRKMENTKRPRHFVYLRTANGTVVRLVCVWRMRWRFGGGGSFSHVEGVVGRRRRVWMTAQPLAASPAVVLCESDRGPGSGGATSFHPHMLTPPVERGPWAWTVCESANDSQQHQSVCVCTCVRAPACCGVASLLMLFVLIFPWRRLMSSWHPSSGSLLTVAWEWPSCESQHSAWFLVPQCGAAKQQTQRVGMPSVEL